MRFHTGIFAVVAVGAIALGQTEISQAAGSECKGLEQAACESKASCSWVRSYKTSKGTEVSAFCRRKPQRKKSSEAAAAPKDS
jgi:hypothetical protein